MGGHGVLRDGHQTRELTGRHTVWFTPNQHSKDIQSSRLSERSQSRNGFYLIH
ncbi:hypothetical protein LMG27198_24040 [Methylocystis echinoides]|uniref:Uncharacterized protein n=1 Tax=Methylocystis echinoides TaxID=29468 RepID=A0A9W6LSE4_9HYPH|nr:hypothetical protein LMG27198_24040 [Methylocystis echinoides]